MRYSHSPPENPRFALREELGDHNLSLSILVGRLRSDPSPLSSIPGRVKVLYSYIHPTDSLDRSGRCAPIPWIPIQPSIRLRIRIGSGYQTTSDSLRVSASSSEVALAYPRLRCIRSRDRSVEIVLLVGPLSTAIGSHWLSRLAVERVLHRPW